ncbi:MAG: 50S ribosomal protein L4 [Candidatus Altiarchaeota archaeon]|nr:50S ribosomal protein L4 [Candidatus Altiarchaeota archaeon]
MKRNVYDLNGKKTGEINLPKQFSESVRDDLIKRAVLVNQNRRFQPKGIKRLAGRMSSAKFRSIRRGYGHSYGMGMARLPRLMMRGGRRVGRVVNVPHAVGGPKAHPPKVERVYAQRINEKERRLAIRSALSATADSSIVSARGHKIPDVLTPFVMIDKFELMTKTKEVESLLLKLGLEQELERASKKRVRSGKGKSRGRKYKKAKGPLVIFSNDKASAIKASRNIAGLNAISVRNISAELLAPGAKPGRLVLITESALKEMKDKKLFV